MSQLTEKASASEEQSLSLDERRFAHEQQIDTLKLELEKMRLQSDARFANRHLASIITGIISFAAVAVSLSQVFVAYTAKEKEIQVAQIQKQTEWEMSAAQQKRDWDFKATEFIATHQALIFGKDPEQRSRIGKVMLVTFPPSITGPLFEQLANASENAATKAEWHDVQATATKLLLVRTDGLYEVKKSDYVTYLRFFPDGTVVMASVVGGTAEDVARWLKPGGGYTTSTGKVPLKQAADHSTFVVQGPTVKFSTKSTNGVVDYEGIVTGDKLILDLDSHINGEKLSEEYSFVQTTR